MSYNDYNVENNCKILKKIQIRFVYLQKLYLLKLVLFKKSEMQLGKLNNYFLIL